MRSLTTYLMTVLLTGVLVSCSHDDQELQTYLYKSEKLNLTELISNQLGTKNFTKNGEDDYIHSELETQFFIPDNLNEIEIENYVGENQSEISGTLTYIMNEQPIITMVIENGVLVSISNNPLNNSEAIRLNCDNPHGDHCDDDYPLRHICSYDGIQDCVQHAVYEEWTTIEAIICAALGGLECIATEAAACIETNCF